MKASTFAKRTSKENKNTNGYRNALSILTGKGTVYYTCYTTGKGKYTRNSDSTEETINVLMAAGLKKNIDFRVSNDAIKGGLTGNYIFLTIAGRAKRIKG